MSEVSSPVLGSRSSNYDVDSKKKTCWGMVGLEARRLQIVLFIVRAGHLNRYFLG